MNIRRQYTSRDALVQTNCKYIPYNSVLHSSMYVLSKCRRDYPTQKRKISETTFPRPEINPFVIRILIIFISYCTSSCYCGVLTTTYQMIETSLLFKLFIIYYYYEFILSHSTPLILNNQANASRATLFCYRASAAYLLLIHRAKILPCNLRFSFT